jgi:integrase
MSCRRYEGKRGPSYYYTIDIAPKGAPRQQKQRRGFRTLRACRAAREKELTERRAGTHLEPATEPLERYLARWLEANTHRWRQSTAANAAQICRRISAALGAIPLGHLTGLQIQQSYQALLSNDPPIAPSTLNTHHTILRQALAQAVRWRLIASNPAEGIALPTRERRPREAWSASERAAFLAAATDDPLLPLWAFLLDSGCRLGEARALAWQDVDLATGDVTIRRTMTRNRQHGWMIGEDTKTAASRRVIRLAPETITLLVQQRRQQAAQRLAAGPLWRDLGLVFAYADGEPMPPDPITAALKRACARACVPVLTSHGLRRTMTTLWLEAGVSPAVVAVRLGHANVSMTLEVYTKVSRSWGEQGVDQVAAYLGRTTREREQIV